MSGLRKVEDGQAAMREGHGQSVAPAADEFEAAVVRPAMSQGAERAVNRLNQLGPRSCCDNPEDSAHKYKSCCGDMNTGGGRSSRTNDAVHQKNFLGVIER